MRSFPDNHLLDIGLPEGKYFSCGASGRSKAGSFVESVPLALTNRTRRTAFERRRTPTTVSGERDNAPVVYLSDLLEKKVPTFFRSITQAFHQHNVEYSILNNTKDIWVRDFMPVEGSDGHYTRFTYAPDYLIKYPKRVPTITNPDPILDEIGLDVKKSDIVLDGGNVVRYGKTAILTDKVFSENSKKYDSATIERLVCELLSLDRAIFVPHDPNSEDEFGHADGMVGFVDEKTLLIDDYSKEERQDFVRDLREVLLRNGFNLVELPYNPLPSTISAEGIYINYLKIRDKVFVPIFGADEDDAALKTFQDCFLHDTVVPVKSKYLAKRGGIIHCATWEYASDG